MGKTLGAAPGAWSAAFARVFEIRPIEICEGLGAPRTQNGVIHRDLKPGNIMLHQETGQDHGFRPGQAQCRLHA